MAVLAPQDWHPPRDHNMDAPSSNPINASLPRQRSSPANDHSLAQSNNMQQQRTYPYPVPIQPQSQQSPWPAPSYYPGFYPNAQPYPMHGPPQLPYPSPQMWSYQQMMMNAQQVHQMSQMSPMAGQRPMNGPNPNQDYFTPMAGFTPFPSGTPPPHPSQLYPSNSSDGSQQGGYHPYRRPMRHGSSNQDPDWSSPQQHSGPFKPPYALADAAGSSTSVNSGSSQSGSQRQRTNSNQGSSAGGSRSGTPPAHGHSKQPSNRSNVSTSASSPSTNGATPRVHQRTGSSSSSASARPPASSRPPAPSTTTTSTSLNASSHNNLRKPSPLSQGTFTAGEKRMSRDDSDLAAMVEPMGGPRSGGLKSKLRRALSLNASATLHEEEEEEAAAAARQSRPSQSSTSSTATLTMDDGESTATVQKKKSRSLFNNKFNRSTDNISLSSTMSSASMVIRKLGSIGKLARRNSLAGITSLFKDKKDKDKDGDEEGDGKKSKKKKGEKAAAVEASVSHVTAELDRSGSDWTSTPDMDGLSPAARLARQHTLKSNAEAAARKAEAEARAQARGAALPTTWEKNTTNRQGENSPAKIGSSSKVSENGMRVVVEHDDSDSDEGHSDSGHDNHAHSYNIEGWEDDEDWGEAQEDEDITIRQALDSTGLGEDVEMEPWAMNVRRSIERIRKPAKGILKKPADGSDYTQDAYLPPNPAFTRARSNSYDSAPLSNELPPLGHLPPSDPAQIDGLHKSHSSNGHSPQHSTPFLPPLSFDANGLSLESPKQESHPSPPLPSASEKGSMFNHPNSSAPALSTIFSANPPTLTHRSATAPAKRLAFASNMSVYDTFPATVYDRRSEPATWSRLTPALAQRIKEELNSYKMEEMEVHSASRVHTQFFV